MAQAARKAAKTPLERQHAYRQRNLEARRKKDRETKRKLRAKVKAEKESARKPDRIFPWPDDPARAVAKWSKSKLVIPPGHPSEGQPLILPDYGVAFLGDVFTHSETSLIIARKNAKSAIVAVLLLAHLAGPLRRKGFRAGVISLNREKAGELKRQAEAIAAASGLADVRFLRTSSPSITSKYGSVDILASGADAGAASGFDLALVDELGLLQERDRALVNGMRSSVSAKAGRFVSLSVFGSGPFIPEILQRQKMGDPGLAVHLYQSDPDAAIDDEANWHLSNPGIKAKIKSLDYMKNEARRVGITVSDQASFQALDLNLPGSPCREGLCTPTDWRACEVAALPPREGGCVVGFDLGSSKSMSAVVALWPSTGRLEAWAAFPDTPNLSERGQADGVGSLYSQMEGRGELALYSGRIVPAGEFMKDCAARLKDSKVIACGGDRFRSAESIQAIEDSEVNWPSPHWRGTGASATADGSFDVRAFQKLVYHRSIQARESLLMRSAIAESEVTRRDGNPKLEKTRRHSRIDVLQAAVIAAGLAELSGRQTRSTWRYAGAA